MEDQIKMFKKLKDKIAEEVKSSPQRVQQLAKSVVGNNTLSVDDNMFSIDEESTVNSINPSPLLTSQYRTRRDSNSSFASDVSFLPSYDSPGNLYHLQSDLDVSASEVEDSATVHADKTQILTAYRNVLAKYNKYRGRYTDLANHYRILERENAKTKAVLVETQDKALRRVAELKEQCQLEQNAKAHIEQVLREDLNERQILIDTLNQKIHLLQQSNKTSENNENHQELEDLRSQNTELHQKLQEMYNSETNNVDAVRDSMKKKIIDLETRMLESRRDLENKIVAKEYEIKNLQENSTSKKISDLQQSVISFEAENISLNNKLKAFETMQIKVNNLTAELTAVKLMSDQKLKEFEEIISTLQTDNKELTEKLTDAIKLQKKVDDLMTELKATKLIQLQIEEKNKTLENHLKLKEDQYEKTNSKLQQINEEYILLQQKNSISNNIQQEFSNLKMERDSLLEQYNTLKNTIEKQNIIYKKEDEELINTLVNLLKSNGITTHENKDKFKLLQDVKNNFDCKAKVLNSNNEICNQLKEEITNLKKIIDENKITLMNITEEKIHFNKEIENLNKIIKEKQDIDTNDKEEIMILKEKLETLQKLCDQQKESLLNSEIEHSKLIKKTESLKKLIHDSKTALNNITNEKDKLNDEIKQLRASFENIETSMLNTIAEKENLVRDVSNYKQLYEETQITLSNKSEENDKINKEVKELNNILKSKSSEISSLLKEKNFFETEIQKLQIKLNENQSVLSNENEELCKLTDQMNKSKVIIDETKQELNNTLQERNQLKEQLKKLQKDLENKDISYKNMIEERNKLQSTINSLNDEKENIKQELNSVKNLLESSVNENNKLLSEIKNNNMEIVHLKQSINNVMENRDSFKANCEQQQIQLLTISKEKETFQFDIERLNKSIENLYNENDLLKQEINKLKQEDSDLSNIQIEKDNFLEQNKKLQTLLDEKLNIIETTVKEMNELRETIKTLQENKVQYLTIKQEVNEKDLLITQIMEELERIKQSNEKNQFELITAKEERENLLKTLSTEKHNLSNEIQYKNELQTLYIELENNYQIKNKLLLKAEEEIENLKLSFNTDTLTIENNNLQENIKQLQILLNNKESILNNTLQQLQDYKETTKKYKEIENLLEKKCSQLIDSEQLIQEMQKQLSNFKIENENLQHEINTKRTENIQYEVTENNEVFQLKELEDKMKLSQEKEKLYDESIKKMKNLELELTRLADERESNVQFYQDEILKLQNKNDKLESKLDETLVTLNHCTELSSSTTEMQYLKNILYNYMMGKESIVLARVIAAVCKFDPNQTDAVLQKEQQKQTLFGHLGLM